MSLLFRRTALGLCAAVALVLAAPGPAAADARPALILSDGEHQNAPEPGNSANDAQDLVQALGGVGFDVIAHRDAMAEATHDFSDRLAGADGVYLADSTPQAPAAAAPLANTRTPAPFTPKEAPAEPRDASAPPSAPATECDKIAALRAPFSSPDAVHEINETDWRQGVEACAAEVQAHPDEMRFVYQLGRAQDHLKNYIEALRDYKTAAGAGFTEAMVDLGALYYLGHGVIQSYPTAFDYFSKATAAGSNRGMANLAAMYGDGVGVARDDAKSLDLAEKAIEAGNPFGLKIVADHYFNGAGVPRDYPMAAQYLQQAADIGDGRSMKFLANMYESGYLGPPNPEKAGALRLRAQQVDPESRDPIPARLPMLRQASAASAQIGQTIHRRRYVVYRPSYGTSYNPAWQAAPGDTRCCPNNMLVCPLGRHFCGH
ncbi:tetratricopeptide repeat protein [Methylocapsa sp. S129]|uniref:tetratricopeptide repeat protein n=1 Tax=Methylocapsa sp. S129 TaxID=1641869 RepID=UPI00131BEDFF|nr:tetratricopeptide repeat protein [Methylocapsa sp. S129]